MIISLENINKSYGAEVILAGVNLKIEDNDRIGLIGVNGAGKSTLLNIISGDLEYDSGTRSIASGANVGFLRQDSGLNRASTIINEMRSVFEHLLQIEKQMQILQIKMHSAVGADSAELMEQYHNMQTEFESGDGYMIDVKINTVLNGMGFAGKNRDTPVSTLSGGEKTRLALCKLLLENPALLILDEPTNHLDFKTLLWLEDYLKTYKGALIIVSHDRFFLDSLVTSVCELDRTKLVRYPGNYTKFVQLKDEAYIRQEKQYEKQQEELTKLQEYVDKNIVRATSSKSAKSKRKAIEHMELIDKPLPPLKKASMSFTYDIEPVKDILDVENLSLSAGSGSDKKHLFTDLNLHIMRGEKIAVIGENGVGKSSLLKAILGLIPNDGGEVTWGRNVFTSYYEQENTGFDDEKTVIDELWDRYPRMFEVTVRTALGNVLLSGDDVYKKVGSLSGGEQARLKFAIMMLRKSNVLILDEPTNHLDLSTKEVLDKALTSYTGTVLMVSHDRYLLSKVPSKIIEMAKDTMTVYDGNYSVYQQGQRPISQIATGVEKDMEEKDNSDAADGYHRSKKQRADEIKRKKQFDQLEADIAVLEADVKALGEIIADPDIAGDYLKLSENVELLTQKNNELDEKYAQWYEAQE